MKEAANLGWDFGPLPIAITCLSLYFLAKAMFGKQGYVPAYESSVFGFAPGLVASVCYFIGIDRADEISGFVQSSTTVSATAVSIFFFSLVRRRGGLPLVSPINVDEPVTVLVAAGYLILCLLFFIGLAVSFEWIFLNVDLNSCGRKCRGSGFLLGNVNSAFTILWCYLFFINTLGFVLIIGPIRFAMRMIAGR